MSEMIKDCVRCEKCNGSGWLEYEVDHFGRKTEWGPCNAPGCVNGEIEIETCSVCRKGENDCKCDAMEVAA